MTGEVDVAQTRRAIDQYAAMKQGNIWITKAESMDSQASTIRRAESGASNLSADSLGVSAVSFELPRSQESENWEPVEWDECSLENSRHEINLDGALEMLKECAGCSIESISEHKNDCYHPRANMDFTLRLEEMGKRYGWLVDNQEIKLKDSSTLGQGTVGVVFKTMFKGHKVAVKVLKHVDDRSASDAKLSVEDMRQETRIASLLEHPNIIRFHGAAISEREPMIIYEYMACGTLEDFYKTRADEMVSKRTWLTIPDNAYRKTWRPATSLALKWCTDLMKGLAYLHGNDPKIIHRDIKPSNLFLNGATGSLKIGDMGLCTFGNSPNRKMTGMTGSLRYMAPEVYKSAQHYDEKVDIFSASLVMYFICTGQRPYDHLVGVNAQSIVMGVAQGRFRPQLNAKGTRDVPLLQKLLGECWSPLPEARPSAKNAVERLTDMAACGDLVIKSGGSFGSKVGSKVRGFTRSASGIFRKKRSSSTEL